jgi:hypothetical protein
MDPGSVGRRVTGSAPRPGGQRQDGPPTRLGALGSVGLVTRLIRVRTGRGVPVRDEPVLTTSSKAETPPSCSFHTCGTRGRVLTPDIGRRRLDVPPGDSTCPCAIPLFSLAHRRESAFDHLLDALGLTGSRVTNKDVVEPPIRAVKSEPCMAIGAPRPDRFEDLGILHNDVPSSVEGQEGLPDRSSGLSDSLLRVSPRG